MKRVASLYLPDWSIDRIRRAEPTLAPPPEAVATTADLATGTRGWRPGARWARDEGVLQRRLPGDDGAPVADSGRAGVGILRAAKHPFRPMPSDERVQGPPRFGTDATGTGRRAVPGIAAPVRRPATPGVLVTVHRIGSRVEIAAASPEARALGVVAGMALTQARASVPALVVRDADPAGDAADLLALATLLARRWSPVVALDGTDGALIDLTGVAHLHGDEARMARALVRLLARAGITARVAVADTAGAAWAMARFALPHCPAAAGGLQARTRTTPAKTGAQSRCAGDDRLGSVAAAIATGSRPSPGGMPCLNGTHADQRTANASTLHIPPSGHTTTLAPLPIAALRLDATVCDLLARLGVATIGDLAAMPRAPLIRRFGVEVARRLDQAHGHAPEPLVPVIPPDTIAVEQRFAEPIATADAIAHWLATLVARLAIDLATAGRGARMLAFVATRVDHERQVVRIGLARATRDPAHMLRLIARRIEEIDTGFGIDALALHVHRSDPLDAQPFDDDLVERTPDLSPLVDTLANRIGPARLWRATPLESDVPERSTTTVSPLAAAARSRPTLRHDDIRHLDQRVADHPWHPRWPRPVRLLRRPEPLDHVVAELPDLPPRRFTWRGDRHVVVRADGPERIEGEWWRRGSERHAVRDYFQVENEAGQRFWLFRRGDGVRAETGDLVWFIHGSFG